MISQLTVIAALAMGVSATPIGPVSDIGPVSEIVGGTVSAAGTWPFIVSLQEGGSHFCGGVLINANTVLTAGHCSVGMTASAVKVRAGTHVSYSSLRQISPC